ncbi:MAG: hypothetical protein KIT17_01735 [Rubrivivax sp.]|nr:hypothetical protein [Rubrivivax sp.]
MALMFPVRVHGEPVAVEVRKAAVRAPDLNRFEPKDARLHVVDRVDLVDFGPAVREQVFAKRDSQPTIGLVDLLEPACY